MSKKDPPAPEPRELRLVDIPKIIRDIKDLTAAIKAGDWLGEAGVLTIVQRMIGYLVERPEAGSPADDPTLEAEFTAATDALREACANPPVGDHSAISPALQSLFIQIASAVIDQIWKWWKG